MRLSHCVLGSLKVTFLQLSHITKIFVQEQIYFKGSGCKSSNLHGHKLLYPSITFQPNSCIYRWFRMQQVQSPARLHPGRQSPSVHSANQETLRPLLSRWHESHSARPCPLRAMWPQVEQVLLGLLAEVWASFSSQAEQQDISVSLLFFFF